MYFLSIKLSTKCGPLEHRFNSWSDGGSQQHAVIALLPTTFVAKYESPPCFVRVTSPAKDDAFYFSTTQSSISVTSAAEAFGNGSGLSVEKVEFYLNGALVGTDATSPYSVTNGLHQGYYALQVKSFCTGSVTSSDNVFFRVQRDDSIPWLESFDGIPAGSISDTTPTSWSLSRTTGPFQVTGEVLVISGAGSEGVFTSADIDTTTVSGQMVSASVTLSSDGSLENSDYVKLIVKINGGSEQVVAQATGNQTPKTLSGTFTAGSKVVFMIRTLVS